MPKPALIPTAEPLRVGSTYSLGQLFDYVPGSGPAGEAVTNVRVGFAYRAENDTKTLGGGAPGDFPAESFRMYDIQTSGLLGGKPCPPFSEGTVTFLAPCGLSGWIQFTYILTPLSLGWLQSYPVDFSFTFPQCPSS